MGFLVPPKIVARPGVDGLDSGVCRFSGVSMPQDGPYAVVLGEYYWLPGAVELVRSFPLDDRVKAVLDDEPRERFVALLEENQRLEARIGSISTENATLTARLAQAEQERSAFQHRAKQAEAALAKTKSAADHVRAFIAKAKQAERVTVNG